MDGLGLKYDHNEHEHKDIFKIPANQCFDGLEIEVDGDWSAAATLLTLGALCGQPELEVTGIRGHLLKQMKESRSFAVCRISLTWHRWRN